MNTLEKARLAGLVVLLEARIGREIYHTVSGSITALEKFEALCLADAESAVAPRAATAMDG